MRRFELGVVSVMALALSTGAALMPATARGQILVTSDTGGGSVTAAGTSYGGPMTPQSATFTGVNTGVSAGNHQQVWADASNRLTVSPTVLSATVNSDADWYDSALPYGQWTPNATDSASLSVSFQVATSGLYMLDASGPGPFGTSQELNQQSDQATLIGTSGGIVVLSISMHDGQSWTTPGSDLFTLTAGTQYTLSLSCSGQSAPWNGEPAEPNYLFSTFTATSVPEPGTISLLVVGSVAVLRRRRRSGQR